MDELTKIAGGVEIDIRYEDGREERVKVRVIRAVDRKRYLDCFMDEAATVELFCDKPKGWADTLSPESFDQIADLGQELNLPLFQNWFRRLKARSEAMNPGLLAKAEAKAAEVVLDQLNGQPALSQSETSASPSPSGAA